MAAAPALTGNQSFDDVQGVSRRIVTETRDLGGSARPRFESGLPDFEKPGLAGPWLPGPLATLKRPRPWWGRGRFGCRRRVVYFLLVAVPSASVRRCELCAMLPD